MDSPTYSPQSPPSPSKRSRDSPMDDQAESLTEVLRISKIARVDGRPHEEHDTDNSDTVNTAPDTCERHRYTNLHGSEKLHHGQDSLGKRQRRLLRQWHEDFARPDDLHLLSDEHIKALATVIQAQPQLVLEFIKQRRKSNDTTESIAVLGQQGKPLPRSLQVIDANTEPYSLTKANNHLDPATLKQVAKYVSSCRRRRSQNDGRRSVNTGPYRCTFGCGYRTKRAFDWRRHEETHEPQELWLCTTCTSNNPFLVNRKDKFLKHVTDKHRELVADQVLDKSKVAFVPRAELGCTICGVGSVSWDERCRHVLGHFEDEVERGIKRVRVACEEEDDNDREVGGSEEGSVIVSLKNACEGEEDED